jgi:hypothetical protein
LNIKIASRGDVWLVNFDPTKGSEINKTRPTIVINSYVFGLQSMNFFEKSIMQEAFVGIVEFCRTRLYRQTMKLQGSFEERRNGNRKKKLD